MAGLRVTTTRTAGEIVLHVEGEVDIASINDLRDAILAEMGHAREPMVLDCARLDFIDAAGLGTLVWFASHAEEQHRPALLRNVSDRVQRLLRISGGLARFSLERTAVG